MMCFFQGIFFASESGEKYAQIKHCLLTKTVQNRSKQICGWIMMREDNRGRAFSLEEALLKHYNGLWTCILSRSDGLKSKMPGWNCFLRTCSFWFHNTLIDGLEWCGLLWCFISCLDSHSDGTHSLQKIHWWTSDVKLHFSKSWMA